MIFCYVSATVDCVMSEHVSNVPEMEESVDSPVTTPQTEPLTVTEPLLVTEDLTVLPQTPGSPEEAIVSVKAGSNPLPPTSIQGRP